MKYKKTTFHHENNNIDDDLNKTEEKESQLEQHSSADIDLENIHINKRHYFLSELINKINSYKNKSSFFNNQKTFKKRINNFFHLLFDKHFYLQYKEKKQQHHDIANLYWLDYYKNVHINNKHNFQEFSQLIHFYGIPDIQNPYLSIDEEYYFYHPLLLICDDIEKLFNFFMYENLQRKIEIALHYDLLNKYQSDIHKAEDIKNEIENLKKQLKGNYDYLQDHLSHLIDNREQIKETELTVYNQEQKTLLDKYLLLTKEYNELISLIPNDKLKHNDYVFFERLLQSAKVGILMLAYGDFFLEETFDLINYENLSFYFVFCFLLIPTHDSLFQEKDFLNKLEQNLIKINEKSKIMINKEIISKPLFDKIIHHKFIFENKLKSEHNQDYYFKNFIQDFNLEDWLEI